MLVSDPQRELPSSRNFPNLHKVFTLVWRKGQACGCRRHYAIYQLVNTARRDSSSAHRSSARESNMNTRPRLVLAALAWAAAAAIAFGASAQTVIGRPSQEEIGRQLKTRGLPTLGTAPTPRPGPGPGVTPANAPSVPSASEVKHRPVHPAAVAPRVSSAPSPSMTLRTITFEFGSAQLR